MIILLMMNNYERAFYSLSNLSTPINNVIGGCTTTIQDYMTIISSQFFNNNSIINLRKCYSPSIKNKDNVLRMRKLPSLVK